MNREVAGQLTNIETMKERLFGIIINGNMGEATFNEEDVSEMLEDTIKLLDRYPEDKQIKRIAINLASGYYLLKNTVLPSCRRSEGEKDRDAEEIYDFIVRK